MDDEKFWGIVGTAHERSGGDMESKCVLIRDAVSKLSKSDAAAFALAFDSKMDAAYSWELWGAAYVAGGGCSDDAFVDFRASLISRGRLAYEQACSSPDSLADDDFDEEAWFYEGYQYAVADGATAVLGSVKRLAPHPDKPAGQAWDEEHVYALYPKLAGKHA